MTLVKNFACNETNFELYPIFDREPVEIFQLRSNVRVFRGMGDNFITCDTWSENEKLELNTTPRFLTLCAGET